MEGNANKPGAEGGHGAVWETLNTMDYLSIKFKQAAYEPRLEDNSHFKSGIERGSFGKRSISSLNAQRKKAKAVSELDRFQPRQIYAEDLDVRALLDGGADIMNI
ncbi:hypothetical protein ED733_001751 [Metarhizium rileyi]|uniref:Uncharacterized protein n=1 Tax=Metarhizium rileyi (strain RCEF 4871) TaxID=1649241 RepID=A0A5C6G0F7_METRR|nr:hypothetical protein ED733_001751 [Metarhizium rileyi]